MPRLDERRCGERFDEAPSSLVRCADRRLARKQTVQELDDRAPFHCSVPSPRFGTKEIAQATAMLRNFKPVDVADGSFAPFLQQERALSASRNPLRLAANCLAFMQFASIRLWPRMYNESAI
jgi:hypothetical protein